MKVLNGKTPWRALAMSGLGALLAIVSVPLAHAWTTAIPNAIPWDYDVSTDATIRTGGYSGNIMSHAGPAIETPGRLFIPSTYETGESFALVIYFHGSGDGFDYSTAGGGLATNVDKNLRSSNANNLITNATNRKFFLYTPQYQETVDSWPWSPIVRAMVMVKEAIRVYPKIDPRRIYVTGLSAGGKGVGFSLARFTDLVAAGVPIAGNGYSVFDETAFIESESKPIWIYHAKNDGANEVNMSRDYVNLMREATGKVQIPYWPIDTVGHPFFSDGSPHYTDGSTYLSAETVPAFADSPTIRYSEYESGGHGIWPRVYNETAMYEWLLSKQLPVGLPAPFPLGKTLLFDFGGYNVSSNAPWKDSVTGVHWNGTVPGDELTKGPSLPGASNRFLFSNAVASDGKRTPVTLELAGTFGSRHTVGPAAGAPYGDFNVYSDGWQTKIGATAATNAGVLRFSGLQQNTLYQIKIWAGCTDDDFAKGRDTRYEINGVTRDLDVFSPAGEYPYAVFDDVTTDSTGTIDVKVYPKPGSTANKGVINTLEIKFVGTTFLNAGADVVALDEYGSADIPVLSNDTGPISPLSIGSVGVPSHGSATIVGSSIQYVPDPGYHGPDSFTYLVTDGTTSAEGTVTITVNDTTSAVNLASAGLTGSQIGAASSGSARVFGGGSWEITGSGVGLGGTSDDVHLESAMRSGDFQMAVRVSALFGQGGAMPRAGLVLREGASADSRMVYIATTPLNHFVWGSRTTAGGAVSEQSSGTAYVYPDAWVLIERVADQMTLAVSADGVTFKQIGEVTLAGLPTSAMVGVFAASGTVGVSALAIMDGFQLLPPVAPISHWKFDETSGTSAIDTMGFTNGTPTGNTAWNASGTLGGAIHLLDGANDYVSVANKPAYSGTALSLSLWFNTEVLDGQPRGLISKRAGTNNQLAFSAFIHTGNRIFIDLPVTSSTNERFDTGYAVPTTGAWHQLIIVFDGTATANRLSVYVDGELVHRATPTATAIPATNAALTIGSLNANYATSFQGRIDDVRVYGRALSSREAESMLVSMPFEVTPMDALADWRALQGLAADGSQDLEMPAGDGVPNLVKYALNLAPTAGSIAVPAWPMTPGGDSGLPYSSPSGLVFVKRKGDHAGIVYEVRQTDDLGDWGACSVPPVEESLDDEWVRITQPFPPVAPAFLRLRVTTE